MAEAPPELSARGLLVACGRLAGAGATWSEIAAAMNPAGDSQVQALLGRIRAAAMGEPPAILKAVEAGCHAALDDNDAASAFDALSIAARNSSWKSRARW